MNTSDIPSIRSIGTNFLFSLPSFELPGIPFTGKFSLSWRDNVMLAGVVLAVASAAGAFFMGLTAAAIGFLALGILLAFSAYYVHNFNEGIELQQTVDLLKQQNSDLQTAQKKIEASTADLQRQYNQVQSINRQLNQTITSLQATTQSLQSANAQLTQNNQSLQANLLQLQQNNLSLQQRVTQLQQAIPLLKEQVASFADQNVLLGKDLNVLNLETIGVDQQTKQLAQTVRGIDMTFDQNVLDLSQQIQRAKAVSTTLFSTLGDQKKDLEKQIGLLSSSVGNLQALDAQLKLRNQELQVLQLQLGAKTVNLQRLQEQIQQTQDSLSVTKRAFDAEAQKLSQIQTEIAAQEQKLEQTKQQLLAFPQKLQDAEKELQAKIDDIEKRQQLNLAAVQGKIQLLIQQGQQLKAENQELARQIEQKKKDLAAIK
ncbi:MAG: hypothetical protein JSS60_07590 [Verrucomicrobia bacterium]|nr:hypothetical protein [Verrucomicrobiota bacterium]